MRTGQAVVPFVCTACGQEFEPSDGGHCGQCGRLFCRAHLLIARSRGAGKPSGRCKSCGEGALVSEAELLETVARMEARLRADPAVASLMSHFSSLAARFELDLARSQRDVALAKASALVLVQAVAEAQSAA
jgi:DNA-directed RNA polymerase subunit RPC12/RpoP